MTYKPTMLSESFGAANSPAAGTSVAVGSGASVTQYSFLVIYVGGLGTLSTGMSIATVGGTFTRIASQVGTAVSTEIWIAYGFNASADGTTRAITNTWTASTKPSYWVLRYELNAMPAAPATSFVSATGTGVTADPTTVTPAVGDLVIAAATWGNVTASSARTDTPGGSKAYQTGTPSAATATRIETAMRRPVTTDALKRTWTITSAEWAACNAIITFADLTEGVALGIKGEDTAAADATSVY